MDFVSLVLGIAAFTGMTLLPTFQQPPFEPGTYDLVACKQYSNSYHGTIRCLQGTSYDICDTATKLYSSLEADVKKHGGVPGLRPLTPQHLRCEKLGQAATPEVLAQQYPNAKYCALDKIPGTAPYEAITVKKHLLKRDEEYTAYATKAIIMNFTPGKKLFQPTDTCNVVWTS